jgi:hypothetical protein
MRLAVSYSPYPSFRKLIWDMKKEEIVIPIPEDETRSKKLLGDAPISRLYYRLNPLYIKKIGALLSRCGYFDNNVITT